MINDIVFLLRRPRESGDPDSIFYNKNFAWHAIRLVRLSHIGDVSAVVLTKSEGWKPRVERGRSMDSRSSRTTVRENYKIRKPFFGLS